MQVLKMGDKRFLTVDRCSYDGKGKGDGEGREGECIPVESTCLVLGIWGHK